MARQQQQQQRDHHEGEDGSSNNSISRGGQPSSSLMSSSTKYPQSTTSVTSGPSASSPKRQNQQQQPVVSVAKILSKVLSISSNRSCADCRSTLVDPSQIYASVSPRIIEASDDTAPAPPPPPPRTNTFQYNHHKFAPPPPPPPAPPSSLDGTRSSKTSTKRIPSILQDLPVDPALIAPIRLNGGGHGVLVCALCGAAHKLLGPVTAKVHPVQDMTTGTWTSNDAQLLLSKGNARSALIYEAYMPKYWELKRPKGNESSVADRLTFIRAKYQALAFVLPQPGPLAYMAWKTLCTKIHPEWNTLPWGTTLASSDYDLDLSSMNPSMQGAGGPGGGQPIYESNSFNNIFQSGSTIDGTISRRCALPDRLVDYFCVVTPSDYLDNSQLQQQSFSPDGSNAQVDLSTLINSPEDVLLIPKVSDCFPLPNTHKKDNNSHEFPEHISTFLFPDGCHALTRQQPPTFFTFVLTGSDGDRLYGGVLRLYDDHRDISYLRDVMENSGYSGKLPDFLSPASINNLSTESQCSLDSLTSDVIYLPKCLVLISHYPFFDLWRKFLLQVYRIALVEAPLPIERFIANFTCEIPLPPPGKIQIKFGYMVKDTWCVERPPSNQLPMADFSFKPLFASLSISNILVVFACLLQETRVALLSKYTSILSPVAEALTSLLFPFHWEGLYLPILPYSMLDILDAPVPYLVGLHSRYLREVKPNRRPRGVVFVDLDRDVVHLGYQEESIEPRPIPCLPEKQALKLRTKLENCASIVYVMPPTNEAGVVTSGDGNVIPFSQRPSYLNQAQVPDSSSSSQRIRRDVFGDADKAYRENDLHRITGFHTEHGQFYEREHTQSHSSRETNTDRSLFGFLRKHQSKRSLTTDSSVGEASKSPGTKHQKKTIGSNMRRHLHEHTKSNNNTADDCLLDMIDPPGFSTQEIREGFLRFFVALLRDYRQYVKGGEFRSQDFVASLHLSAESAGFVTHALKTQLFSRFIEDRYENPHDPEVQFFDESINAKMNRSKRHAFNSALHVGKRHGQGPHHNKKDTSFLDDTSAMVTETYTPPPPSNWGLPDDGRKYSYGKFPPLNPNLFGKIRAPRKFASRSRRRMTRRMSVATQAGEQAIFAKANRASILATPAIVRSGSYDFVAAAKRGAKNLEYAITALSSPFAANLDGRDNPAEENSNNSGHQAARSPRGSGSGQGRRIPFSGMIMNVNTNCMSVEESALSLPSELEISPSGEVDHGISSAEEIVLNARRKQAILLGIIITFQRYCRVHASDVGRKRGMERISRVVSMKFDQRSREVKQYRGATKIQAHYRGYRVRSEFRQMNVAAARLQGLVRGRRTRFVYCDLVRHYVIKSQALCRGYVTRRRLSKLLKGCLHRYRQHIFVLWALSHTSLCYRTKFWAMIRKDGIIQLGLAEEEILRLWIEFQVQPPSSAVADKTDDIVLAGSQLGVPNTTRSYIRVRKVEADKAFASSINGVTNDTRDRVTAERIQIYERLTILEEKRKDDRLAKSFIRFNLQKDKRKKAALAEMIWNVYAKANESSAFMLDFFPELQHSPDIHFREPSKKGVRRVKKLSNVIPRPLDKHLCIHTLYGDRVRRNVREVADASLRKVPALTLRLSKLDESRRGQDMRTQRLQRIIMETRNESNWCTCRRQIVKDFLAVGASGDNDDESIDSLLQDGSASSSKFAFKGIKLTQPEQLRQYNESTASFNYVFPGEGFWFDENANGNGSDDNMKENHQSPHPSPLLIRDKFNSSIPVRGSSNAGRTSQQHQLQSPPVISVPMVADKATATHSSEGYAL